MATFVNMSDSVRVERALTEMNEALRKADALKNDFVQHVSYELRSPLTNIIGFTDLLKSPLTGELSERQAEYVDHISTSSSVLLTTVNDILDLATVDAGIMQLDLRDIDLSAILDEVAEQMSDRLKENDLKLQIERSGPLGWIVADPQRLKQILFKLLSNAANYAPDSSVIRLECRREGDTAVFAVSDSGPGIPEDVLKTVFDRFETHEREGRRRGAGLGLSIVESFVSLHHGDVSIESRPGEGHDRHLPYSLCRGHALQGVRLNAPCRPTTSICRTSVRPSASAPILPSPFARAIALRSPETSARGSRRLRAPLSAPSPTTRDWRFRARPSRWFRPTICVFRSRISISIELVIRTNSPNSALKKRWNRASALVEWPENAGTQLPADALQLHIEEAGKGRRVTLSGGDAVVARTCRSLAVRAFLERFARGDAERRYLLGDASPRAYERVRPTAGPALILMNAPRLPKGPPVRDGRPYTELARIAEDVRAFVAVDGLLRARGLTAPEILASDLEAGLVLLEDFGREGVLDADGRPIPERYEVAIEALAVLHGHPVPGDLPLPDGTRYAIPPFDRTAMSIEVEQLVEWYVPWQTRGAVSEDWLAEFRARWSGLIELAQSLEQNVLLRDVHSPNLFWLPQHRGEARIGLIDFQDAMIGPTAYDVASLIQDARVTVEPALADRLTSRYVAARRAGQADFDAEGFNEALAVMAAQRATKILGIFVRLKERDGKPGYLAHIPRLRRYLAASLAHPVLHPLRDLYDRAGILRES